MAYIYQAALWCDDCGSAICERLKQEGKAPEDPEDETSYDSDDYPKYAPDGGGPADSPQHCDAGGDCINAIRCGFWPDYKPIMVGAWLENDLTSDGVQYVHDAIYAARYTKGSCGIAAGLWGEYYPEISSAVDTRAEAEAEAEAEEQRRAEAEAEAEAEADE